jgi:hypothetical protein
VISAGGSNLYGADTGGAVTTTGFFPVKNSTIFLNMGVSYALFITECISAKKSDKFMCSCSIFLPNFAATAHK